MNRLLLRKLLRTVLATAPLGACGIPAGCPPPSPDMRMEIDIVVPADTANGQLTTDYCKEVCPNSLGHDGGSNVAQCQLTSMNADAGSATIACQYGFQTSRCIGGRRYDGLAPAPQAGGDVGGWFASMAWLEAASIEAFDRLARELSLHGAPEGLIQNARRAARDERRHARSVGLLARRFGGAIEPVQATPFSPRSLVALAIENEAEGVVRETWGAMVAAWQSRAAVDKTVRRVMQRIWPDEARHAELAFEVRDWATPKLSRSEVARVEEARASATSEVVRSAQVPMAAALISTAGLPSPADARRLLRDAIGTIWA